MNWANGLRIAALALAAAGIAACEQQTPRVVEIFISENGTQKYLGEAAQKGPIQFQMLPAEIADAAGYQEIALATFNNNAAQRTKSIFTANPGEARSEVRTILMIGAGEGASGSALCRGAQPQATLGDKETKFVAVLCRGDQRLAEAHGWVRQETAAQDEEYRLVIVDLANALFQRRQQGK